MAEFDFYPGMYQYKEVVFPNRDAELYKEVIKNLIEENKNLKLQLKMSKRELKRFKNLTNFRR